MSAGGLCSREGSPGICREARTSFRSLGTGDADGLVSAFQRRAQEDLRQASDSVLGQRPPWYRVPWVNAIAITLCGTTLRYTRRAPLGKIALRRLHTTGGRFSASDGTGTRGLGPCLGDKTGTDSLRPTLASPAFREGRSCGHISCASQRRISPSRRSHSGSQDFERVPQLGDPERRKSLSRPSSCFVRPDRIERPTGEDADRIIASARIVD